jgi:hypothetical protein
MHYDFGDYLNTIKYLDKDDILEISYKKHQSLDKILVLDKKEGGTQLQTNIQYLLFFLEKEQHPSGMTAENFAKLKPICENLIKKNQLAAETINLF